MTIDYNLLKKYSVDFLIKNCDEYTERINHLKKIIYDGDLNTAKSIIHELRKEFEEFEIINDMIHPLQDELELADQLLKTKIILAKS